MSAEGISIGGQIPDDANYETLVAALEQTVQRLESGELSLEASVDAYEHGMLLVQRCNELLDKAELRVTELSDRVARQIEINTDET